uniref:Ependymin-like 1 n=1 Tax=Astatotilapia calliptera TaxID=8154 RepID=A0AAX7SEN5_ASTCA
MLVENKIRKHLGLSGHLSAYIRKCSSSRATETSQLPVRKSADSSKMKLFVVLVCVLAGCLAEKPRPCKSPPLLTGALTVSTQNEKLWVYAKYLYDAWGQRVRLMELGNYQNKSFTYDALLLFREAAMYEIDDKARTCKKKPLKADFHPMEIPINSTLVGQAVLGSSSGPGEGLLVNTWTGNLPGNTGELASNVQNCHPGCLSALSLWTHFMSVLPGKYLTTFTEFGCIPVNTMYQTQEYGWMVTGFFNNVVGISDPGQLNPPDFCPTEMTSNGEKPEDFTSLFFKLQ